MGWFIRFFSPGANDGMAWYEGIVYGMGYVAMSALYTFTHHPFFFGMTRMGMRIRAAVTAIVYRKVGFGVYDCLRFVE